MDGHVVTRGLVLLLALGACEFDRPKDIGSVKVTVRGLWDGSDGIEVSLVIAGTSTPLPFADDGDSGTFTTPAGTPYEVVIDRQPTAHTCAVADAAGALAEALVVRVTCTGPVMLGTEPAFDVDQGPREQRLPVSLLSQLVQFRPSGPDTATLTIDDVPLVINTPRVYSLPTGDTTFRIVMQSGALSKTMTITFDRGAAAIVQDPPTRPPLPAAGGQFGSAISMTNNTIMVGTPGKNLVRTFVRNGRAWVPASDLTPPLGASERFGASVSLNGDALIVGAPGLAVSDRGSAHIFERQAGVWTVKYNTTVDVMTGDDQLGYAVALAGGRAVVGGPTKGDLAPVRALLKNAAAMWQFDATIASPDQQASDLFGAALALRGATAIIGAPMGDGVSPTTNSSGRVYTFDHTTSWTQTALIEPAVRGATDQFGAAVALELTGPDQVLVVGAPFEDGATVDDPTDDGVRDSGAAYVFRRTGTGPWVQEAYLKPSNRGQQFNFGAAVAIADELIAIGAPGEDSCAAGVDPAVMPGCNSAGAVFVFEHTAQGWREVAYLKSAAVHAQDVFGRGLTLTPNFLVAGAPADDGAGSVDEIEGGVVYPFH